MFGLLGLLFSVIFYGVIIIVIVKLLTGGKKRDHRWLKEEVPLWEKNNIISPQQSESILAFYNLKAAEPRKKMDMIKVLTLIGSIFVGIGVIFFIASNWEKMPHYIRTTLILGVTILTLYMGYFFSYMRTGYVNLGKSLLLLASLFWGGTIALIGQIYHLSTAQNWLITILWALPILPIAVFYGNQYVHIVASALLIIFNFSYSYDMSAANYYYPLLVLGLLLPTAKGFQASRYINIIGLIIASIYCTFLKYEWLSLLISLGLLGYYLLDGKKRPYLYAATISFICWAITYLTVRPTAPNLFFIIPMGGILYITYKDKSEENLLIALIGAYIWAHLMLYSFSRLFYQELSFVSYFILQLLLAMLTYIAGVISENEKYLFARIYKGSGYLLTFMCIYILSFRGVLEASNRAMDSVFFFFSFGITAAIVSWSVTAAQRGYFKSKVSQLELASLMSILFASAIATYNPFLIAANVVVLNAALVILALMSILIGVEMRDEMVFNSGIFIFVLFIITRYVDVGWRLKEKSLFFILGGLIIMALGASLEKQRRKIIEKMREK